MALNPELKIRLANLGLATALHVAAGVLLVNASPMGDPAAERFAPDQGGVFTVTLAAGPSTPAADAATSASHSVAVPAPEASHREIAAQTASSSTSPAAPITPAPADAPQKGPSGGAPPAAAATASVFAGADADHFREALLARIARFRRYPPDAQRDHVQGTVWVRLLLDRSGRVMSVSIDQSSGQPSLDEEALAAVRRADPLPAIPAGLPDRIAMTLAVDFSLA